MGYCVSYVEGNFIVKIANEQMLLERIRSIAKVFSNENITLRWVLLNRLMNAKTLEEQFYELRYELSRDDEFIYINEFIGDKLGEEEKLFSLISDLVEYSYMEMYGEDGSSWRWVFKDNKFYVVRPEVKWKVTNKSQYNFNLEGFKWK